MASVWRVSGEKRRTWRLALPLAALALLSSAFATRADAYVYWVNNANQDAGQGTIGRANNDGTGVDQSFIQGLADPCGVAVNSQHIFWGNRETSSIGRANLNGTDPNIFFITGATSPCGPSLTADRIYWVNFGPGGGSIARANLNGTAPNQNYIVGPPSNPFGTGVNSTHLFWANTSGDSLSRFALDLGPPETVASTEAEASGNPQWPAATNTHLYWSFNNPGDKLVRRPVNGSGSTETIVQADSDGGVAIHAGKVYWATSQEFISRANLDGSGREFALVQPTPDPFGIAVDSGSSPPPPPADCTGFEIGKAERNKKKGKATLPVEVPCAGSVELSGKGLKAASTEVDAGGEASLPVKAKGKAKKALRKKGKKKVKPEVTYTPTGGEALTKDTQVKLVKK